MALRFSGPAAYVILAFVILGCLNWIFVLINGASAFYHTSHEAARDSKLSVTDSFENFAPAAKDLTWYFSLMSKDMRTANHKEYLLKESMTAKEKDAVKTLSIFQFIIYFIVGFGLFFLLLGIGVDSDRLGIRRSVSMKTKTLA